MTPSAREPETRLRRVFTSRLAIFALVVAVFILAPYALDFLWGNVPIVFYGRVVDESGAGVPNATVTMNVIATKRLSLPVPFANNQTGRLVKTTTASDGSFVIHGGRGTSLLMVGVEKSGYKNSTRTDGGGNFYYSKSTGISKPYVPNPDNPVNVHIQHVVASPG